MPPRLRAKGKTAPGTHVPVLLKDVMAQLTPLSGEIVVDCTLGYGGHAARFAGRIANDGKLIGLDIDVKELEGTKRRLEKAKCRLSFHNTNFGNIAEVLRKEEIDGADIIFADIGVSSMQVDDPARGISYKNDGPLDMRMDGRLEKTGADLLAELSKDQLSQMLRENSDEPDHEILAQWIVAQRISRPITKVSELIRLVFNVKGLTEKTWKKKQKASGFGSAHPAARTFQALRIMVNDELDALKRLLAAGPECLKPGGRIGIISFHSGEDRLVKGSFRGGYQAGVYEAISEKAIVPGKWEIMKNPRSSSARFRWARKAKHTGHD